MNPTPCLFGFGLHNHQPVGNFESIFEEAYQKAYLPFLDVFEQHEGIRITQHFTGILLDWFENHHPKFIDRIGKLVDVGRIELMGGGYYEPILVMLPKGDSGEQLEALNERIRSRFGQRPKGAWVAERIWEPSLTSLYAEAGLEYVVLDDAHFKMAGLREDQLTGPFMTEDQGLTLTVFPISQKLRYIIPFHQVEETIEYLKSFPSGKGTRCVIMADDGEKFGIWPETYKSVYEEEWLEEFFTALEKESKWLEMVTFSEARNRCSSQGLVYLPTASYSEMMDWALPWEEGRAIEDFRKHLPEKTRQRYGRFIKGSFWRSFLTKYREIQHLHRKVLSVSESIHKLPEDSPAKQEALRYLWAAECNCGYWHGVFGGIYLNHIRAENYHNLILAEQAVRSAGQKTGQTIHFRHWDFFRDGGDALEVTTPTAHLLFDLEDDGSLVEWDFLPKAWNLVNTLSRHPETYHRDLLEMANKPTEEGHAASIHDLHRTKEKGLERLLVYDPYRRGGNILHFLKPGLALEKFTANPALDLREKPSGKAKVHYETTPSGCEITFSSVEKVKNHAGRISTVEVQRIWTYDSVRDEWILELRLQNQSLDGVTFDLGMEFGWSLNAGATYDRFYRIDGQAPEDPSLGSVGESSGVGSVSLTEDWWGIRIEFQFEKRAKVWRFPIETVSSSEGGFERTYQSSVVIPSWPVTLTPGGDVDAVWSTRFHLKIHNLPHGGAA